MADKASTQEKLLIDARSKLSIGYLKFQKAASKFQGRHIRWKEIQEELEQAARFVDPKDKAEFEQMANDASRFVELSGKLSNKYYQQKVLYLRMKSAVSQEFIESTIPKINKLIKEAQVLDKLYLKEKKSKGAAIKKKYFEHMNSMEEKYFERTNSKIPKLGKKITGIFDPDDNRFGSTTTKLVGLIILDIKERLSKKETDLP